MKTKSAAPQTAKTKKNLQVLSRAQEMCHEPLSPYTFFVALALNKVACTFTFTECGRVCNVH